MSDHSAAIAVGVVGLAAVGVGAYVLTRPKAKTPDATIMPVKGGPVVTMPASPSPTPSTLTPPATTQDVANLLAQQQTQQDARLAQMTRDAAIRDAVFGIGQIENKQLILLAQLEAIDRDNSRLEDLVQQEFNGILSGPTWTARVNQCLQTVQKNCGFDVFAACWNANKGECSSSVPNYQFGNPASVAMTEARKVLGPAKLELWKADQRKPFEAELSLLEYQYRTSVAQLKGKYGVDYAPSDTRPHDRAKAIQSGAYSAPQIQPQSANFQSAPANVVVPAPSTSRTTLMDRL